MKKTAKRLLTTVLSLFLLLCGCYGLTRLAKTANAETAFNVTGVGAYNVNDDRFYVVLSTDVQIHSAGQQRITVSVEKAGVKEEISVIFNAFNNADIQIPTSAIAKTGEKGFVTIPKGTTAGEFVLATDYTFFVNDGKVSHAFQVFPMVTDRCDQIQMSPSYARYRMFFDQTASVSDGAYCNVDEAYIIKDFNKETETSEVTTKVVFVGLEGKLYLKIDTDDLAGVATAAQVPERVIYVPQGATITLGADKATVGRDIYLYINGETVNETFREEKTPETLTMAGLTNQPASSRFIMTLNGGTGNGEYGSEICDVIVKTDGAEKTAKLWNWGEDIAIYIPYDVLPATGYHTLEITAQAFTEQYYFGGVNISVFNGSEVIPLTLERTGGQYQADTENSIYRYVVYFNDLGGEFRHIGNVSITVNDTTSAVAEFYQWNNGKSALLLNSSDYPTDTEYKITVNPCQVDNYYITNSVSFYIGNEEIYEKTEVTYTVNGNGFTKAIVWGEANFNTVADVSSIETGGVKVIGYTYGGALYDTLSKVYEKASSEHAGTPESVSFAIETIEFFNEAGAYIRTNSDYQGLRFTTKIAENKNSAITEYGMYFTSVQFFASSEISGDFTKITDGVNGYKISSLNAGFKSWLKGDGYEYFSSVIDLSGATFKGYKRKSGRAGIRNEIYIIPTVGCVNDVCRRLEKLSQRYITGSIDGIYALTHQFGCSQLGEDNANIKKLLCGIALNPNASFVLFVGLGCENNGLEGIKEYLEPYGRENISFFNCQDVEDETEYGLNILKVFCETAKDYVREEVPTGELCIGLKCGGSDGYSGLTANPLVGRITDRIVEEGGSAILTEVPEMFGAERLLMNKCASREVYEKYLDMITKFKKFYTDNGFPVYENPSPRNKRGGITTLEEKSLGCVKKVGSTKIVGVLSYGEQAERRGVSVLNAPGNDLIAATALAASGCQAVLFTTGRGTPFSTFVPTLKIATNDNLAEKKRNWIDFNAYSMDEAGLYDLLIKCASGEYKAKSEDIREIAFYKTGVTL